MKACQGDVAEALKRWEFGQLELGQQLIKWARTVGDQLQHGRGRVGDPLPYGHYTVGDSALTEASDPRQQRQG